MVVPRYPSPGGLSARERALKKKNNKNYIGQDYSERAMVDRGQSRVTGLAMTDKPKFAPSGPLRARGKPPTSPNGVTTKPANTIPVNTPAPSRRQKDNPDLFVTRGTRPNFLKTHPVLNSKKGEARDIFLANHPKINANVNEFEANAKTRRQQAIFRRLRKAL